MVSTVAAAIREQSTQLFGRLLAAALHASLEDVSRAEYEAVMDRLSRSARTVAAIEAPRSAGRVRREARRDEVTPDERELDLVGGWFAATVHLET